MFPEMHPIQEISQRSGTLFPTEHGRSAETREGNSTQKEITHHHTKGRVIGALQCGVMTLSPTNLPGTPMFFVLLFLFLFISRLALEFTQRKGNN
jgi:hypothetical protein